MLPRDGDIEYEPVARLHSRIQTQMVCLPAASVEVELPLRDGTGTSRGRLADHHEVEPPTRTGERPMTTGCGERPFFLFLKTDADDSVDV